VPCATVVPEHKENDMIVLGLILLIIGLVAGIGILTTIGVILLIVGLILNLVPIGGTRRRVY
jgi:membrane protein implicated in regulation of membrane protease activity